MDNFYQGAFLISRSTFDDDLFTKKPAEWFKIWIYILGKVNFKDNGLPRGSRYFKYDIISEQCGVTYNVVEKCINYLKKCEILATQKATHGVVISVLNYAKYQNISNYKSDDISGTEAEQKRNRSDNINKNERMKEGKNISKDIGEQALVVSYGNEDINKTIGYISKVVGCSTFKESQVIQRRYGKHLFDLGKKIGAEEFNFRLKTILEDPFKQKNSNKLAYLYGELKSFIHSPIVEEKKPKVLIF